MTELAPTLPRRTPRSARRGLAMLTAVVAAAAGAAALGSGGSHASAAAAGLRYAGHAHAGSRLGFTLMLRLPGQGRLDASLKAIENPSSPRFRHVLGPRQFGSRFGLPAHAITALERRLRTDGLRVDGGFPQRTSLRVSGTVATIERVLSTRIGIWTGRHGEHYHAPLHRPVVPASLRSAVAGVTGLDSRPHLIAHDVPFGGLAPNAAALAYDVSALHRAGFEGQGLNIAVISFSAFDPRDPAAFVRRYGIAGPAPKVVPVDGGTDKFVNPSEADLDIEIIRAIAPQAQILFYEVPLTTSGYADAINRIVADGRAQIISASWGECERHLYASQRANDSRALSSAAAAGISLFVSSGDAGAYDCQSSNFSDHRLTVDWPSASASAISVGGTRLAVARNGAYLGEAAWDDQLSNGGGGGGVTIGDARPSWQDAPGLPTNVSNGRRQVPDISADADPGTPWSVFVGHHPGQVGGTSAAAPFWAASMLLIQQYAAAHGVHRLGFVDPVFYALARADLQPSPFHDVTRGTNRYYRARPGWDPATGLGSPDVGVLAQDIVAYLRAHPG